MWANGRMSERPQDDDIGTVSVDWVINDVVICTYSALINSKNDKVKFKAGAIKYKDNFIAREAKQDTIGNQITNYMNN